MKFLIDTNSLIYALDNDYKPERFSLLWSEIYDRLGKDIFVTKQVRDEIVKGKKSDKNPDNAVNWVKNFVSKKPSALIDPLETIGTVENLKKVLRWLRNSQLWRESAYEIWYEPEHADAYLIAAALSENFKIITAEKETDISVLESNKGLSKQEPKITTVCNHFGVEWGRFRDLIDDIDYREAK